MYHSREIRWFFDEENSPIVNWFELHGLNLKKATSREDYYHRPTLGESLGIKLREGRVEVKHRTKGPYDAILFSNTECKLEEWMKWSFRLDEEDEELKKILSVGLSDNWLKVHKKRIILKIGLNPDGKSNYFTGSELPDRGCQIEYSRLKVLDKYWYSFGLEWFGEPWVEFNDLELREVIESEFKMSDAQSYPFFLSALI